MRLLPLFVAFVALFPMVHAAEGTPVAAAEAPVRLDPMVVEGTSLANMDARIRVNLERGSPDERVRSFVVVLLEPRSPLKKAGLKAGDSLTRINGTAVKGLRLGELKELIRMKQKKFVLEVQSEGATTARTLEVDLRSPAFGQSGIMPTLPPPPVFNPPPVGRESHRP